MSVEQEQQMKKVEITIDQAKKAIDHKSAILRLSQNRDFNMIVNEGYFKQEPRRLVLMLADPMQQEEVAQEAILREMGGISYFHEYLRFLTMAGTQAEGAMASHEATREELVEEIG